MVRTPNPALSLCHFLLLLWTGSTLQSLTHTHTPASVQPSPSFLPLLSPLSFLAKPISLCSSAELEARGRLDGVQQFVPHQVLVAELWQLEQVHAGAGGGQALQVAAPIVDAEDWVKFLRHPKKKKKTFKIKKKTTNWLQRWRGF